MMFTVLSVRKRDHHGMIEFPGHEKGGVQAEVKVRELDHPLVAILEPSEGGCRLVRLFHDESDSQTDWYDNSQHKAYVDVTDQVSGTPEEQHLVSEIMNRLGTIDG